MNTTSLTSVLASPAIKYITILPGQTQVIKKSAKILAVLNSGGVTYTSTCGSLPDSSPLLCYTLGWEYNENGSNETHPWSIGHGQVQIVAVNVGGIKYTTNLTGHGDILSTWLVSKKLPILINITPFSTGNGVSGQGLPAGTFHSGITFQSIDIIAADMYVEFQTNGSNNSRIYPLAYDCPSSNS